MEFCDLGNPNGACSVFELKSKPDVSVIVTTYNAEKTIESSLASLQEQTLANIEIIVVDDFSDFGNNKLFIVSIQATFLS